VPIPAGEFICKPYFLKETGFTPSFFIMKYPVTIEQYRIFCIATGRSLPISRQNDLPENHPVIGISSDDAIAFAEWAGLSVPTKDEWCKAAQLIMDEPEYPWGGVCEWYKWFEWKTTNLLDVTNGDGNKAIDNVMLRCLWYPESYFRELKAYREKIYRRNKAKEEEVRRWQSDIEEVRRTEGLCTKCGRSLGFLDKLLSRTKHSRCYEFKYEIIVSVQQAKLGD
jgi:hypothetical protein